MRSRSGMLVAPERRMSSWVITKMAAATLDNFCSFLDTEVTSMFIRSSMLFSARSFGFSWDPAEVASSSAVTKARWLRFRALAISELGAAGPQRRAFQMDFRPTIIPRPSPKCGFQQLSERKPRAVAYGFSGKGELLREDHGVRTKYRRGESRGIRGPLLQE